jgi:hypothetical protein
MLPPKSTIQPCSREITAEWPCRGAGQLPLADSSCHEAAAATNAESSISRKCDLIHVNEI